jgi:hypothetical protein
MLHTMNHHDVIIDFWEWYQAREGGRCNPLAGYALDKCEEAFRKCEWNRFGYWHAIYLRARPKRSSSYMKTANDQT